MLHGTANILQFLGRIGSGKRMLSRFTKAKRLKAAAVLALFYALCSVAPAAAFTFGDGSRTAHCLSQNDDHGLHAVGAHQHSAVNMHSHEDGTAHVHGKKTDSEDSSSEHGNKSETQCCGLICLSALPASVTDGNLPDLPHIAAIGIVERRLAGQLPVRLDRPPNS
jgi:hypothetical protein